METARHHNKYHILITDISLYAMSNLALSLLKNGHSVYAQGSAHSTQELLKYKNFTHLEVDLTQPLPAYLPKFDYIFESSQLVQKTGNFFNILHSSPKLSNIIMLSVANKSKLFVLARITTTPDFISEYPNASLLLVGDVYGPGLKKNDNKLSDLIIQAQKSDKIILEHEGLDHIYPTYISDFIYAIEKCVFENEHENVQIIASGGAKTSLSVAYEIQNALRLWANKEVNLFFAGAQPQIYTPQESPVKVHDLNFTPKFDLKEGLKKTFEYSQKEGQIEEPKIAFHLPRAQEPSVEAKDIQSQILQKIHQNQIIHKKTMPSLPKIPSFDSKLNFKKILLLVCMLFFLTLAKLGIDLYLATNNLKNAQNSLKAADFAKAKKQAQSAKKSFHHAANKIKYLSYPTSFILQNQTKDANNLLIGAELAASSASYFIDASENLKNDFAAVTSSDGKNEGSDLEVTSASFKKAYLESTQAMYIFENVKNLPLKEKIQNAASQTKNLHKLSQTAFDLTKLTPNLTGGGGKKTYLVLLQNNAELRPGGGFIGNYATVEFDKGKLQNIAVDDIYNIDGQLKEKIEPPQQLKDALGVENFFLRDSNWSGDFDQNAKVAKDLFKKETGKDVDGVVAIDLTFIQEILQATGPILLPDYKEEIGADNLFERGEYYSEIGFQPGSTGKKDFFGTLTKTLVEKIVKNPSPPSSALLQAIGHALPQKHMMLAFDDSGLSSFVKTRGWDNPLPPVFYNPADDTGSTKDYLALVEANVGANKVNEKIDRKVFYEMTIGRDADLVGKLTITYTNNSQAETWPAGKYVNYLRVYTPFAAGLEDFSLSIAPEAKEKDPKAKNTQALASEDGISDKNDVTVTNQGNLTVFETMVEVPIKSTQVVTFVYRIPKNIDLEDASTYSIYFQKQAGTEKDPLEFKFNLPAYLNVVSVNQDQQYSNKQNITLESDLSTDKHFTIEIKMN